MGQAWDSGGAGIRTQGTLARPTVFKTAPFDRSGTPPKAHCDDYPERTSAGALSPQRLTIRRGRWDSTDETLARSPESELADRSPLSRQSPVRSPQRMVR